MKYLKKKLNALINIEEYDFFKQCYIKNSDDWYYLSTELNDQQKDRLYAIQLKLNKA